MRQRKRLVGLPGAVSILLALAAGLVLRVWMAKKFPQDAGDPQIYADLAKNLLLHGQLASTGADGVLHPTLIRLPGYPLFMALCFVVFGMKNLAATGWLQIALELAGCLLLVDFVRRISSPGAAHCTLWLAALCPFTAVYAGAPLTETPTLFLISLALWSLSRFHEGPRWTNALLFTGAVTYAALLRPDGALVAIALAPAILVKGTGCSPYIKPQEKKWVLAPEGELPESRPPSTHPAPKITHMAVVCALLALTPFAMWTWRNWRVFHVIQPLAPRYAVDPGEDIDPGWQRWVKTWCLDFVSTYEIYWNVPGDKLDINQLPSRAFDSPRQYAETAELIKAYEANGEDLSPELDARFGLLAAQRIADHPLRYYLWLPLGRLADMWLRPRVENLPIDLDWWVYSHHYAETRFSWFYSALNAFFLVLGIAGLCLRPRYWQWMLLYFVLRSALLTTIEAPEARYTLECFPMLFAVGGIALYRLMYWVFLSVLKVKASLGIG